MEVLERQQQFLGLADLQKVNEVGRQQKSVCWHVNAQTLCAGQVRQSFVNKLRDCLEVVVWEIVACRTDDASILKRFSALERTEIEEGLASTGFQVAALHHNKKAADYRVVNGQRAELCERTRRLWDEDYCSRQVAGVSLEGQKIVIPGKGPPTRVVLRDFEF